MIEVMSWRCTILHHTETSKTRCLRTCSIFYNTYQCHGSKRKAKSVVQYNYYRYSPQQFLKWTFPRLLGPTVIFKFIVINQLLLVVATWPICTFPSLRNFKSGGGKTEEISGAIGRGRGECLYHWEFVSKALMLLD